MIGMKRTNYTDKEKIDAVILSDCFGVRNASALTGISVSTIMRERNSRKNQSGSSDEGRQISVLKDRIAFLQAENIKLQDTVKWLNGVIIGLHLAHSVSEIGDDTS